MMHTNRTLAKALALFVALWLLVPVGGMAAAPVYASHPYPASVTVSYGSTTSGNLFSNDREMNVTVPFGVTAVTVFVEMSTSAYQQSSTLFDNPQITFHGDPTAHAWSHSAQVPLSGNSTRIEIILLGTIGSAPLTTHCFLTINRASQPPAAPRSAGSGVREPDTQPELELEKATIGNCGSTDVYAGAGKQYGVIGHLSAGAEIELYEWFAGGTWCRVFYSGGKHNGWVPAEVIIPQ